MANVSIITAFLNEADNLPAFKERVLRVVGTCCDSSEIVLVDDHSTDASSDLARDWTIEDPRVQYIRLSRSCGSHAAFSAGLAHCTGDCAVLLAADLQDPPELVPQLMERWREGNDVVWAVRSQRRSERFSTRLFARAYYAIMRQCALSEMPTDGADFLLMDRKVVDAYNTIPEKNTSFLAMILWMGFRQTSIEYVKQSRHAGQSKWSFSKKVKLLIDSIVSFSYKPIRLVSVLGLLVSLAAFIFALHILYNAAVGNPVEGYSSLMLVVLATSGIQLLMLGVLGEYLWRAFDQARGRPWYIVEEQLGATDSRNERQDAFGAGADRRQGVRAAGKPRSAPSEAIAVRPDVSSSSE